MAGGDAGAHGHFGDVWTAERCADEAAEANAAGTPMTPMPMGMGANGMPNKMMGRDGASPHVVQSRPTVVPRSGVG